MRIGVIGAGNIGGTLARHLAKLGHQVSVANSRGPESLTANEGLIFVDVPKWTQKGLRYSFPRSTWKAP